MKVSGGLMFVGVVDGDDGVAYELRTSVDTLTMPSGATSATFAFKASCYSKSGNAAAAAYPCYFSVYRRTGTSLVYATRYASKVSSRDFSISNVACTVDAIVVFATDTLVSVNASAPTTYVAKCEMAVLKDAPYYVDEYARSITRDSDGYLYSKIDSSTGTSSIDSQPGWNSQAPNPTTSHPYIWRRTTLYTPSTNSYGNFAYVCLTGEPGEHGAAGKTGRMFYLAGSWDGTKTYERNDSICPIVEHDGSYWYLDANSSTGDTPNNDSTVWKKCENFGVVLTEALFADFGKLGKAIMSGDYMFSMNGRIGNTEYNGGAKIEGVPAYTRFMGDPDALRGSFSADDRYGPIAGDPEIIAEIYLAKGVTLNVSVTAKRISGSGIGYFCIYKNGQLTSQSFNSAYVSTKTMTWTSTEDGWYKIEYYNSISSTHFRFSVSYNITGYFEPNWWVDLMTGKMVAARGNFVVNPNGDIILKNLFRRAAFTWYSQTGIETRVVNTGNVTSAWVYMKSKDDDPDSDFVAIMNKYGIDVGDYLEMTPDMDASDYWYIMDNASWGYDSENCHFIVCTYYADMVVALDIENNESNVFLPAAKDFSGKVVEVYNSTTGTGVLKVRPADLQLMGIAPSLNADHFTLNFNYVDNRANYYPVSGGGTVTFYSNGSTWIVLRNNRPT